MVACCLLLSNPNFELEVADYFATGMNNTVQNCSDEVNVAILLFRY